MAENSDIVIGLLQSLTRGEPLSYSDEKRLAGHKDSRIRRHLASRSDARPEILYYLAGDSDSTVRCQIAANKNAPQHADILLAQDHDVDVRSGLALKIGRLAPDLADTESDRLAELTIKALEILARDEIVKVRKILAETLKDVANAPPHIVRRLAEDPELEVCAPVLRYSPLLDDDDLLEIVFSNPVNGALTAISRRNQLPETICDAIVDVGQRDAITALLANKSAQIREKTLDHIINQAPGNQEWHEPLARRPGLSTKAARKISTFLADSLLDTMRLRTDFKPETLDAVENEFRRRLAVNATTTENEDPDAETAGDDQPSFEESLSKARQLDQSGALSEGTIQQSIEKGQNHFVLAALAIKTALAPELIRQIFDSKNPQGIVALLRKAQIGERLTRLIQRKVAQIPPRDIIDPETNPMREEDVEWQIGLFREMFSTKGPKKSGDKKQSDQKTDGIYDPQWSRETTDPALNELDWERQPRTDDPKNQKDSSLEPEWAKTQRPDDSKQSSQPVEPDWATDD